MGRSMMRGGIPLFVCLAVLATLINAKNGRGLEHGLLSSGEVPDWMPKYSDSFFDYDLTNSNTKTNLDTDPNSKTKTNLDTDPNSNTNTNMTAPTTTPTTTSTTTMATTPTRSYRFYDYNIMNTKTDLDTDTDTDTDPNTTTPTTTPTSTTTTTTTPTPTTAKSRPLYEKDGFLAGEETPVYFATFIPATKYRDAEFSYTLIKPYGTPIVKKAWQYWEYLLKEGRGFPARTERSVDGLRNLTYMEEFHDVVTNPRIKRFDSPSPIENRSADNNEVVYPSVLVVMDYADVFPTPEKKFSWSVEEFIMYALAFWGTVDSSLRNIQNPRVSLRIAGIVIAKSRWASPYLRFNRGEKTFEKVLPTMINYWRSVSKRKGTEFPIGSYDIVAHMTDMFPWSNYVEFSALFPQNHPIVAAASQGPPCKLIDQIGGAIINDDLAFEGIHRAIGQMSKLLGGASNHPMVYGAPRRKWTKELVDPISKALKDTTCMSAPKQLGRSGKPVPAILAGELMPNVKQCEAAGYNPDAWTCWDTSHYPKRSNCHYLYCSNQHVWGVTCSEVGLTLDGSFCNAENTKICLDGQCVDKV